MFSLTNEQIAFIENDIKVRGITSPDLSIDLLDHICCLIENELDEYRNFDTVYQETLLLFGEKGLKKIQLETNRLLTFKHYYFMNSTMKISGYVSSMMILFGSIFKFQHWPGANVLLVLGVFFLTVLFLPLLFVLKFKSSEENNRSILLSVIGFVSSLLICAGVLFRVLHWPGARTITIAGCVLLLLAYLPIYFLSIYKNTTNKINATATVILIIAGAGLFITESGMNGIPRPTSDSFWRGIIENDQLLRFIETENKQVYLKLAKKSTTDSLSIANINEIKNATDDLMNYTEKMKFFLIAKVEEISETEATKINLDQLRTSGDGNVLYDLLLNEQYASSYYTAQKLKDKIETYKQIISKNAPSVNLSILNTGNINVYGEEVDWKQSNFDRLPISLVVYNLIRIELAIKTTESAALGANL